MPFGLVGGRAALRRSSPLVPPPPFGPLWPAFSRTGPTPHATRREGRRALARLPPFCAAGGEGLGTSRRSALARPRPRDRGLRGFLPLTCPLTPGTPPARMPPIRAVRRRPRAVPVRCLPARRLRGPNGVLTARGAASTWIGTPGQALMRSFWREGRAWDIEDGPAARMAGPGEGGMRLMVPTPMHVNERYEHGACIVKRRAGAHARASGHPRRGVECW